MIKILSSITLNTQIFLKLIQKDLFGGDIMNEKEEEKRLEECETEGQIWIPCPQCDEMIPVPKEGETGLFRNPKQKQSLYIKLSCDNCGFSQMKRVSGPELG